MKTFRFFATLLVIVLCAGFTSCSDDNENLLVGTWVYIESDNYKDEMTINSDGTGSRADYFDGKLSQEGVKSFKYTYDEKSKVFTFIYEDNDHYSMHIQELTNSKLIFNDNIEEGELGVITYTKQ